MDASWHESLEEVVKKIAEQCLSLSWAHEASQRWTASWNTRLMFPSIILSSLVGIGSVGSTTLLPFDGSTTLVGILSLTASILQTFQNYYAFAKRSESHRIASLQYSKLHSFLSLQLSLPRNERIPATDVIEMLKVETEKLADVAPLIPQAVKDTFQQKFGKLADYSIAPILNGLEPVKVCHSTTAETPTVLSSPRPVVRVIV